MSTKGPFQNSRLVHYKNIELDLTGDLAADTLLVALDDPSTRFFPLDIVIDKYRVGGTYQTDPQIQLRVGSTATSSVLVTATAMTDVEGQFQRLVTGASGDVVTGGDEFFARISTAGIGQVTATRARAAGIATIATAVAHGLVPGDRVRVHAVGTGYDGLHTVLTVPSTTTFTFASEGADEAVTADVNGDVGTFRAKAHVVGIYW